VTFPLLIVRNIELLISAAEDLPSASVRARSASTLPFLAAASLSAEAVVPAGVGFDVASDKPAMTPVWPRRFATS